MMKYMKFLFFVGVVFLFNNISYADCGYINDQSYLTTNVSFGDVYVQRDSPVGTSLGKLNFNTTSPVYSFYFCTDAWVQSFIPGVFNTPSVLGAPIYNTNIAGIGIKMTTGGGAGMPFYSPAPAQSWVGQTQRFNLELIKTSATVVSGGQLTQGAAVFYWAANGVNFSQYNLAGNNNIIPLACSINTPTLTFPIGDVLVTKFSTTVGTIPSGAQNTQSLGLDCDQFANINVMLQGTQNPDVSATSVLALTGQGSAGVADGVGVQLLYNDTPLELNQRIVLKQSAGGQETFPIVARYYQTKNAVTTGKADASATLELTYQ